ncbi:hypothetical protein SNK05_007199 [Fusarium graminearum]
MDRDRGRRFDDGEVVRYGAGESWRPTPRDRSPRRVRSPARERVRSPVRDRPRSPRPRSPRPRSPIPAGSDSYVPGRYPPRRRSRSGGGDRYRRERSRAERESPRRRERSRSMRRPSPRRSLSRRPSPPPPRGGGDRYERPRSPAPVREWERDRERVVRDREWDRDRVRDRGRDFERRDDRRRSRSPFGVIRRDRSPPVRSPVTGPRGGSYRPRSRSMSRRGNDRYQSYRRVSPPRESGISSAITSQSVSGRSSPRPSSVRARSPLQSREQSPHHTMLGAAPLREAPRPASYDTNAHAPVRSPPRGPAALRAPPTGPAANRNTAPPVASPAPPPPARIQTPTAPPQRSDTTSPTIPPAGPRGYVPPARGGFAPRGGRGGWNQPPTRQFSGPSPTPSTPNGPSAIPTGPRVAPSNVPLSSTPTQSRPFNPPTGPSAQHAGGARQTLAQSMLATLPPIIPGGKLDPSMTPISMGVTRELEPHYRKLKDEEEKVRDELHVKQERLRKSIYTWNRLERDSRAWEMRSDLSEKSMKNLAGEGMGGAAF